jgi:hypothetical protein
MHYALVIRHYASGKKPGEIFPGLFAIFRAGRSRAGRAVEILKYDWDKIEHEYVTGKCTMEELARKHKIPLNTFYKRSKVRNFSEKRENYTRTVQEKAIARARARDVRTLSNLGGALDKAARILNKYLTDEDTLFNRISMSDGVLLERRAKKLDTKAVRDLTAAVREATAAMRLLAPEQTTEAENQAGVIILPGRDDE